MMTLQERVHGVKPPKDWPLNKLHHVFTVRKNNKNIGMLNDNLLSLSYGKIVNKNIGSNEGLLPESFETYQIVYPGDIVLRLTDLQNDKRSIRQGLVKEKGIITSAYDAVYLTKGHDPRYWAYTLLALDLAKYYYSMGGGVRQSIKFKDFPNDWLNVPPHDTQKEIADFLDRETSRIDQLIEKKEKLLKTLEEKSKSELSRLVTEGIEKVTEFKKSIYSWQPDIPKHWQEVPFGMLMRSTKTTVGEFSKSYKLLSLGKQGVILRDIESGKGKFPAEFDSYQTVKPGQIILCLFDMDETPRTVGLSNLYGMITGAYDVMSVTDYAMPEYIYLYLLYLDHGKRLKPFYTGLRKVVRMPTFRTIRMPLPSIEEQKKVVEYYFELSKKIDSINQKTQNSLDKISAFRCSLVTEAVTGQLDINAWQKRGLGDRQLDQIEQDTEQEHKSKKARA
jgi:type I restriction enzyme S subunit